MSHRLFVGGAAAGAAVLAGILLGLALGRFTTAGMSRYSTPLLAVRPQHRYEIVYPASEDIFAAPGRSAPVDGRIVRARASYPADRAY